MKIAIPELKSKVIEYLTTKGLDEIDSEILAELIVQQELVGNQFSPVGELPGKHARLFEDSRQSKEEVVVTKPALKLLKGNVGWLR